MDRKAQEDGIGTLRQIVRDVMPRLPYHNFRHAIDVYSTVNVYAILDNVSNEERFLLRTSALLHDIIVVLGSLDNEAKSGEFACQVLPCIGYSHDQTERVRRLILGTRMTQDPHCYLEKLLCDADLDNLGRSDFLELGEGVRCECGLPLGRKWYEQQLEFLRGHEYHTEIARKLRDAGKASNIERLEKLLEVSKC